MLEAIPQVIEPGQKYFRPVFAYELFCQDKS